MGSGIWRVVSTDEAHALYWGKTPRHVRITTSDKDVKVELDGDDPANTKTFDHVAGASVDVESTKVVIRMKDGQPTNGTYEVLNLT